MWKNRSEPQKHAGEHESPLSRAITRSLAGIHGVYSAQVTMRAGSHIEKPWRAQILGVGHGSRCAQAETTQVGVFIAFDDKSVYFSTCSVAVSEVTFVPAASVATQRNWRPSRAR